MARAYSIASAPRSDDTVELQIRRVKGGRLSAGAFDSAHEGEHLPGGYASSSWRG